MQSDLAHAFATIDQAIRLPAAVGPDRRCPDTYEAITTLEALGGRSRDYAETLWRLLASQYGPQPRHQAGRVMEVLRGIAERMR